MIAVAILSVSFLTSCNKGLKDDMKELEQKLAEEQAKNAKIRQNLGGDACFSYTFSTNDGTNAVNLTDDLCLYNDHVVDGNYVIDYGDSTYYVYVERTGDYWDDYLSIGFDYDSKTGIVELDEAYLYAIFPGELDQNGVYFYDEENTTNNVLRVTSFNRNTGAISFSFNGATLADFSDNYYSNQPMTLNFNFSGDLYKIDYTTIMNNW